MKKNSIVLGSLLAVTALVAIPGAPAASASEPEKSVDRATCADSYKNAQVQRRNGSLKRARESLIMCVSDRCPAVLQPDCMRWLTEVEAAIPSVAFAAKGVDGKDVTDVRVTLDGQVLRDSLDGKAVNVDPGPHTLRFEHGAETPIDQQIVVREGEKARFISVSWQKAVTREEGTPTGPDGHRARPSPAVWAFGGIGVAGLASFGVLGIHGLSRRSDLQKECFGNCDPSRIESIKTEFAIADIALGVGIVSVGVATVLLLTGGSSAASDKPQPAAVSVGVAPHKDGAALGLSGRF